MAESSMFWDGVTLGDATAAPYDAATEFAEVMRALSGTDRVANLGGVIRGVSNQLQPTVAGAVSPVSINTGSALCHGTFYTNTSAVLVTIPNSVASRYDRIVLRKSWAAQTVRITRIAGVEGGGTPALVQTLGTTWDVPIVTVRIQVAALTIYRDDREFLPYKVPLLTDLQVYNEVEWGQTGFAPANYGVRDGIKVQMGIASLTILAPDLGGSSASITFPNVFNGDPLVFVQIVNHTGGLAIDNPPAPFVHGIDDNHFLIWQSRAVWEIGVGAITYWYHWIAIGPELK